MQRIVFSGTVLAVAVFHAAAYGSVLLTTGDFGVFSATVSDRTPAHIHLWAEQSGLALPTDVTLDTSLENYTKQHATASPSASRAKFIPASGRTIAAGTAIHGYFAYFDPRSDSAVGSVPYDTPVSGIVGYNSTLPASDSSRAPGAPYPANPAINNRGMEGANWAQLSADRDTLTSSLTASSPRYEIHELPGASAIPTPVPEPSSFLLFCTGLLAFGAIRRCQGLSR